MKLKQSGIETILTLISSVVQLKSDNHLLRKRGCFVTGLSSIF